MIPAFNHSHVLPPFLGHGHSSTTASPYDVNATELVARFGTSPERLVLLDGLFRYRAAWRDLGFSEGFQWLDGSFVEDVEQHMGRPPADVDVVTFAYPPNGMTPHEINAMMQQHSELFDRRKCKDRFGCDSFLVRLNVHVRRLVRETTFWHGVFSHRRGDQLWKGLLQIPLASDDDEAKMQLENLNAGGARVAAT